MMCITCERFVLKLKLRSGELMRTPVGDESRLTELCEEINALNAEFARHRMMHCYWWFELPKQPEASVFAGVN